MKNIVILGGGFGGLRTAIELARHRAKLEDYKIILVDKNLHHTFTPLVYEVATGYFAHEGWRSERALSRGAEITISKIVEIACRDCVEFVIGEVTNVDLQNKKVLISGKEFNYEYLVVALGAESDYFGIEGLREHSTSLKDLRDAVLIHHKISEFIKNKQARKSVQLQIMVGGGGATGVEFAAELAYYFRHVVSDEELRAGDYEITLIEAGSRLASFAPAAASKFIYDRLSKLGVKVLLDTCIKKVKSFADKQMTESPHQSGGFGVGGELVVTPRPLRAGESADALLCSIAPGEEKRFTFDLLVWAGGIRGSSWLKDWGFQVDAKGRVAIDEYCSVRDLKNVLALGDCAVYIDPASGKSAPWLAQTAIEQGHIVAAKILADLVGAKARAYRLHPYPTVLPMGGKNALLIYKNFYTDSILGWLLHEAASLRYFISTLRLKEGLKLWLRGAWTYSKND